MIAVVIGEVLARAEFSNYILVHHSEAQFANSVPMGCQVVVVNCLFKTPSLAVKSGTSGGPLGSSAGV